MRKIRNIFRDCAGATAIEYGLIATLIAVALISSIAGIGSSLNDTFSKSSSGLGSAA